MTIKCPICLEELDDNVEECPACSFKFSGSTEKFEPISTENTPEDKNTSEVADNKPKSAVLRVISGPQGEILLPLAKDKMKIGRSPNSDIFLNDRTVSREHAIIAKVDGQYQIADSNSYNGLWVNNKNVNVSNLENGDLIQIGVFFLRFEN